MHERSILSCLLSKTAHQIDRNFIFYRFYLSKRCQCSPGCNMSRCQLKYRKPLTQTHSQLHNEEDYMFLIRTAYCLLQYNFISQYISLGLSWGNNFVSAFSKFSPLFYMSTLIILFFKFAFCFNALTNFEFISPSYPPC